MKALTRPVREQVTRDWKGRFDKFGIFRPMWLGRIVGPIFQGICLEQSSAGTSYAPTTHIHFLCRTFPVVSLTLAQRLLSSRSGTNDSISLQFHDSRLAGAADALEKAALLSLSDAWGLSELIDATERYRALGTLDAKYPLTLLDGVVLTASWLGRKQDAQLLLDRYGAQAARWPEAVFRRFGGHGAWVSDVERQLGDHAELAAVAEQQLQALKLADLPRFDMRRR